MAGWPVMLQLEGRRCVVLGGGGVALRRSRSLLDAGATVTVIAPRISDELARLTVTHQARPYQEGDLAGAMLVVLATNDSAVHELAAAEARQRGILVNRTDAPRQGDITIPAHAHHGPVTLAVDTSGISAAASATIRRQLSEALDPDWPRLLDLARPVRDQIQREQPEGDRRREMLRGLTNERAMNILKVQGTEAAARYMHRIAQGQAPETMDD
jgi:precorrin-2 dehydrogenase/sirohydrochlorin ferrochelatase